ncbi:MAG: hypothetical protein AAFR10_21445 [Pseudomonadota bacterium]
MFRKTPHRPQPTAPRRPRTCCNDACCQELLVLAAEGTLCTEQPLEHRLDHLERAQ